MAPSSHPALTVIDPPEISASPMTAQVVSINSNARVIHTSGQMPIDRHGNIPAAYPDQIKLCLDNLDACLKSAGAGRKDIVKLTYYIVNYNPTWRPHAEILMDYLQGHRPCTTLVPVPALARAELLFEIEAVAALQGSSPNPRSVL
ncbi:YjgF-like protein [Xylona heveae TC161]|uniref:YjgF-like protein n=1 Tax=Xylona heveae (strain CBS 132557 / TC161) TaxID=1328760 RepID=A0A165IF90_XYLHT|nr:YjgF-like protein [Xylona heveae TC161]KZF24815.1 YjgF-like protein [Xylona heveae TC161]